MCLWGVFLVFLLSVGLNSPQSPVCERTAYEVATLFWNQEVNRGNSCKLSYFFACLLHLRSSHPLWAWCWAWQQRHGKGGQWCQWVSGVRSGRLTYTAMNNSVKVSHSSAIRAEVKRHEALQNNLKKLLKQLERVEDQQLRSGLKLQVQRVQGEPVWCFMKKWVGCMFFLQWDSVSANYYEHVGRSTLLLREKATRAC